MVVRVLSPMSGPHAWGSGTGRRSPWSIWHWRPMGLACRSSLGLGDTETPFLKEVHRLSCALGPRAKQSLHRNLGQIWLQFLEDLLGKQGVIVARCRGRTLEAKVSGIIISVCSSRGGHFGKIWPYPSGLRSPGQTTNQVGTQLHPSANRLHEGSPRCTAASNHTQRQSPNHRRDKNQPHLPVGRHQSLPLGSLQQGPIPTSATRGQTSEARETTTLSFCLQKETTQKIYTKWKGREVWLR